MRDIFIIGAGHGGILKGKYQTDPKKGKQFDHGKYGIAYEGEINRDVASHVYNFAKTEGIKVIYPFYSEVDIPLSLRVDIVNSITETYGSDRVLYLPLHSNAGNGNGFEAWTSPGDTDADPLAELLITLFEEKFPYIKVRKDTCDVGNPDSDKEAKFYELINTICPTILPEWLFFEQAHPLFILFLNRISTIFTEIKQTK